MLGPGVSRCDSENSKLHPRGRGSSCGSSLRPHRQTNLRAARLEVDNQGIAKAYLVQLVAPDIRGRGVHLAELTKRLDSHSEIAGCREYDLALNNVVEQP